MAMAAVALVAMAASVPTVAAAPTHRRSVDQRSTVRASLQSEHVVDCFPVSTAKARRRCSAGVHEASYQLRPSAVAAAAAAVGKAGPSPH
eukprot:SAG31_NODE_34238_length_335_cov_0.783898_1_plen_89_part_01